MVSRNPLPRPVIAYPSWTALRPPWAGCPLIAIWVKILRVPYYILFPLIFLFCVVGAYAENTNVVDVYLMIMFGGLGYLARKSGFEPAPFVLAYVLGPLL